MENNDTLNKLILISIFSALFAVACISGKKAYEGFTQYKESKNLYETIKENNRIIESKKPEKQNNSEKPTDKLKSEKIVLNINFNNLKERNSDCIGWIYLPNTEIDYPILQSYDDEYYLFHTIDKVWNVAGSIFIDKSNNEFEDKHTIVYGHNMNNGTMFAEINNYKKQEFYDNHKYIYIGKEDGTTEKYQIYSCYPTVDHVNPYKIKLESKDISDMIKRSIINCDTISISSDFKIITLSTCTSRIKEERFVVHAVLIDSYK